MNAEPTEHLNHFASAGLLIVITSLQLIEAVPKNDAHLYTQSNQFYQHNLLHHSFNCQ